MITVEKMRHLITNKLLSQDEIRCIAYMLESRSGQRSDFIASMFGKQLANGQIGESDLEFVVDNSGRLTGDIYDKCEAIT